MFKPKPCKICGKLGHYAYQCRLNLNPRKPIKRSRKPIRSESAKNYIARVKTYHEWMKLNPPDNTGHWDCYLQISQLCLKRVTVETLTLEHVIPRSKRPDLKFDVTNIRPSCSFCNKLKSSQTLEQLARNWPHLNIYLSK